jgi:hypothetical protein
MSSQRKELGLLNRDGSLSRRAVRMKVGTRVQRRKSTKKQPEHNPRARELVRRAVQKYERVTL